MLSGKGLYFSKKAELLYLLCTECYIPATAENLFQEAKEISPLASLTDISELPTTPPAMQEKHPDRLASHMMRFMLPTNEH